MRALKLKVFTVNSLDLKDDQQISDELERLVNEWLEGKHLEIVAVKQSHSITGTTGSTVEGILVGHITEAAMYTILYSE